MIGQGIKGLTAKDYEVVEILKQKWLSAKDLNKIYGFKEATRLRNVLYRIGEEFVLCEDDSEYCTKYKIVTDEDYRQYEQERRFLND